MTSVKLFCRAATPFLPDGKIDADALRRLLQRFVDLDIGVYLASAGSAESAAFSEEELRLVYRIGVETCKGKVPANGNPPERQTVAELLGHINLAIDAGVELVNVYGPPGWHAYRPTDDEYLAFFDELLPEVNHPIAISPNPDMGYTPKPGLIADICQRYPQIVAINLNNQRGDQYYMELRERMGRKIDMYVSTAGSLHAILLGAAGIVGGDMNIIPKSYRRYADLCQGRMYEEAALVYADIRRFNRYVSRWDGAHPRWIKMAMKVLKLPGGEGGLRPPYRMPAEEELQQFAAGLRKLNIPEIDELFCATTGA